MESRIKQLEILITDANKAYRNGEAIIDDSEYDSLIDELTEIDSDNQLLSYIGIKPTDDGRKQKLPVKMGSMEKIKTIEQYFKWQEKKKIPSDAYIVMTPKYDGISLLSQETTEYAWTRGDGFEGEFIPEHYKKIPNVSSDFGSNYTVGELIISREKFQKYDVMNGGEYKNGRNMVGGNVNSLIAKDDLTDMEYIRYGIFNHDEAVFNKDFPNKESQLIFLNKVNREKVPYVKMKFSELTENYLYELFNEWNTDFEIDGIIIELDDNILRKNIGYETNSNNPGYARAFKGNFEDIEKTFVKKMDYQISKQGYLKPVIHINPIKLNGVIVSKLFGDNGRWVAAYGIGVGTELTVKRSGMVIPRAIEVDGFEVIDAKSFNKICDIANTICIGDSTKEYIKTIRESLGILNVSKFELPENYGGWNDTLVELVADNSNAENNDTINQQKLVSFFEIMGIENVSDKTIIELWNRGYTTLKQILEIDSNDMRLWDGWGDKKTDRFKKSISDKLVNVPLEKVQHASGLFYGLGSKKLALVKHFTHIPTIEELIQVDGFSDISAEIYLKGINEFWSWIEPLPISIASTIQKVSDIKSDKMFGWVCVFTGIRDEAMERDIISHGGEIKSGISKNSTHLIMKEKGSGSSKESKALVLGNKILTYNEMKSILDRFNDTSGNILKF